MPDGGRRGRPLHGEQPPLFETEDGAEYVLQMKAPVMLIMLRDAIEATLERIRLSTSQSSVVTTTDTRPSSSSEF